MRKVFWGFCCILSLFLAVAGSVQAETRYVSDQILITLRRGPGTEYKILKNLQTGTPLEVLEDGETWLKVRHQDGTDGYVLRQYLTGELPKTLVIARLQREKERLQSRIDELGTRAQGWTAEKEELQRQISDIQQAFRKEKSERLTVSSNYTNLQEAAKNVSELLAERERLKAENEKYAGELQQLREENGKLLRKAIVKWFLAGGGVLLVGWLMGKSSRTKKRGFA
jgi:SH3 domain protein